MTRWCEPMRSWSKAVAVAAAVCQALAASSLSAGDPLQKSVPKAAQKKLPVPGEVFEVDGHAAFLIQPVGRKPGARTPWVWYAPTLRDLPGDAEKWMFERFLAAGIAITGVDVGESYGSPAGRAIYSALYRELVEGRGMARKACLLARSRGGLMLYNWAAEHPSSVACVAGIYPVCNLSSYPGLQRACGAYGMTAEQLAAKLAEHNPIDRLAPLANAGVPIFHLHGDRDEVVPLEQNSGELARRYEKLGGHMTLVTVKGQGHNMWSGWFQSQPLVDFVTTHAAAKGDWLRRLDDARPADNGLRRWVPVPFCGGFRWGKRGQAPWR